MWNIQEHTYTRKQHIYMNNLSDLFRTGTLKQTTIRNNRLNWSKYSNTFDYTIGNGVFQKPWEHKKSEKTNEDTRHVSFRKEKKKKKWMSSLCKHQNDEIWQD